MILSSRIESFRRVAALLLSAFTLCLGQECAICGNRDEYPGDIGRVISARYVGTYTCGQLYFRGLENKIPGFMCGPLQDYIYEPCKCDPSNPHPNEHEPAGRDPCWIPPGVNLPADFNFPGCQIQTTPSPTPPTASSTPPPTPPPTPAATTSGGQALPLRKELPGGTKYEMKLFRGAGGGNQGGGPPNGNRRTMELSEPLEVS